MDPIKGPQVIPRLQMLEIIEMDHTFKSSGRPSVVRTLPIIDSPFVVPVITLIANATQ